MIKECIKTIIYIGGDESERRVIKERMTEACIRTAVEAIHSSPYQAVLYLAGGASQVFFSFSLSACFCMFFDAPIELSNPCDQALGLLLSVPGASNTVLEAVVPYSRMSLIQLLAKVPFFFHLQFHHHTNTVPLFFLIDFFFAVDSIPIL